jgi:hypothetical protein
VSTAVKVVDNLVVQIVRFVEAAFPGWVECELVDANGRRHIFRDKIPIFTGELLNENSNYPRLGTMPCKVVERFQDPDGRELVRVSIAEPCGIESTEGVTRFTVPASLVASTEP